MGAEIAEPVDASTRVAVRAAGMFAGVAKHLLLVARLGLRVHPEELAVLEAAYRRACWLMEGRGSEQF